VPRRGRGGREAAAEYALRTTTPSGLDENGSVDDVDDDDEVIAAGPLRRSVGGARKLAAAIALGSALSFSPLAQPQASRAYEASDYASETVTTTVEKLRRSAGNIDESFRTFEEIAAIIAEGKGVGGSVSASGVNLERGFISDEDTTIYNPGLTLLTESEKERLVEALVSNRDAGLKKKDWSENNDSASRELKHKLDPLHMYELRGYLGILPFWGAAVYLGTLFVQQNSRANWPVAYVVGALAVFGPVVALFVFGS